MQWPTTDTRKIILAANCNSVESKENFPPVFFLVLRILLVLLSVYYNNGYAALQIAFLCIC
jgi:hypothetical protein